MKATADSFKECKSAFEEAHMLHASLDLLAPSEISGIVKV
jgi:hypothetical protein